MGGVLLRMLIKDAKVQCILQSALIRAEGEMLGGRKSHLRKGPRTLESLYPQNFVGL